MFNNPTLIHVIGFDKTKVNNVSKYFDDFYTNNISNERFLKYTSDIFRQIEPKRPWRKIYMIPYQNSKVGNVLLNNKECDIMGFPLLCQTEQNQDSLYNHIVAWSLLETDIFKEKNYIQISYLDLLKPNIKKDKEYVEDLIKEYNGNIYRKYKEHPTEWFDKDFKFAKLLFQKMGFEIDYKDLNRYIILLKNE